MTDHLAGYTAQETANWYHRLADKVSERKINGQEPLSAKFLRSWLNNRQPKYTMYFQPPQYLKTSDYVTDVLKYHRAVFLTEQKARFTGGAVAWAGILPRLQGLKGFNKWNLKSPLSIDYESLVEVGNGLVDLVRIQKSGTPGERDLLTSLRGFQLKSYITVNGTVRSTGKVSIQFIHWECEVIDKYDFNYNEYFTPLNPDFGRDDLKHAIRPQDRAFRVYHSNAKRIENAKLACPYSIQSYKWQIGAPNIVGPAEIDPAKQLK